MSVLYHKVRHSIVLAADAGIVVQMLSFAHLYQSIDAIHVLQEYSVHPLDLAVRVDVDAQVVRKTGHRHWTTTRSTFVA